MNLLVVVQVNFRIVYRKMLIICKLIKQVKHVVCLI